MSGTISLSGTEFSVAETDGLISISIVRSGDQSQAVNVEYNITVNGGAANAASSSDVSIGTFFATIPANESSVDVDIAIFDDVLAEGTENFYISIVNVDSGTLLFPRTARIDILDDEQPEVPDPVPPLETDYNVTENVIYSGLAEPVAFEFSPVDGTQMFVATKRGFVTLFDTATGTEVATVLDLRAAVNTAGDRGLLDIALHPDFLNNPYLYAFYVVDPPETASETGNAGQDGRGNRYSHVVRYELDATTGYSSVVAGSETVIVGTGGTGLSDISGGGAIESVLTANVDVPDSEIDQSTGLYKQDYLKVDSASHAGGSLAFGPDGALYISVGDGTSFNLADPRSVSVQDVNSLSGKILRVDPMTGQGLADNPFVAAAGGDLTQNASKVYQLGFRNPFAMGFDENGDLFVSNTGWSAYESIFTGPAGANFGWPWYEGEIGGVPQPAPGYSDPVAFPESVTFYNEVASGNITITPAFASFSHVETDPGFEVQAIAGADNVIGPGSVPESLEGYYLFTDLVEGQVYAINTDDRRDIIYLYDTASSFGPVHFKQGPDGTIYYADVVSGVIGTLSITQKPIVLGDTQYVLASDGLTRAQAEAEAAALGGNLLRIDNQIELEFILEEFWREQAIYLDASDVAVEGTFVDSSGAALAFTNWRSGQPDDAGGGEDYAVIADGTGGWDDQVADGSSIYVAGAPVATAA
ncbi:MAG: PQQ-dependent sugar dehydrogenase, partial [Pseudomonadota bacterium]